MTDTISGPARAAIGVDVGGTKIAGAIVAETGECRDLRVIPTPRGRGARTDAEIVTLIDELVSRGTEEGLILTRAAVGVPEYVTPTGQITSDLVVGSLGRLPGETPGGAKILIDSDVRCAARAESRFGHGQNLDSFLFVIIGTGISSTLVIDGRLWAGHRGEAIALGELSVDPALALRPGAPLTVEEQASGRAISEAVGADRGTGQAEAEARAGEIVARALNDAVRLLDPAAVIIGGGLGTSDGDFFRSLSRHYLDYADARQNPPPLLQARLGSHAGIVGAGLLALEGRPTDLLGH